MRGIRSFVLYPQPFAVAGKTFIEPDIFPFGNADGITKPLVRQFMGDKTLKAVIARDVVGAKDG